MHEEGISSPLSHSSIELLLSWLESNGATGLSNLKVCPSSEDHGGLGIFAINTITPKSILVTIPQSAIMSATKSWMRPVGCTALRVFQDKEMPPDELILWLDMALGRLDISHPHHAYLQSMPNDDPTAFGYPDGFRKMLAGTNLGVAVEKDRDAFFSLYDKYIPPMLVEDSNILSIDTFKGKVSIGVEDVQWARAMYYSRRFPARLATTPGESFTNEKNHNLGIMLPYMDLLNHKYDASDYKCDILQWNADSSRVTFMTSDSNGIESGKECYNSYGRKGNEELLNLYGFSILDNIHDTYGLSLAIMDDEGSLQRLGPFYIRRVDRDSPNNIPRWNQFPCELWNALAFPGAYLKGEMEGIPPEIEYEDVEILHSTLQPRLQAFLDTSDRDTYFSNPPPHDVVDWRTTGIARYRDGQRKVLQEAIETLEQMLKDYSPQ